MKRITHIISLLFVAQLLFTSCEKTKVSDKVPSCLRKKINNMDSQKGVKVWEWKSDTQTLYYLQNGCCDQFNYLYDAYCNEICAPDGGITGGGDGKCQENYQAFEKTLIWEAEE